MSKNKKMEVLMYRKNPGLINDGVLTAIKYPKVVKFEDHLT